jgi:hypothetical protein
MDERRTLLILAWTLGGVVGTVFIMNAIALSSIQSTPNTTWAIPGRSSHRALLEKGVSSPVPRGA